MKKLNFFKILNKRNFNIITLFACFLFLSLIFSCTPPIEEKKIISYINISAGNAHSLATTKDGTLWVTGNGGFGKLGNDDTNHVKDWLKIENNIISNIKSISAGSSHSLAVKDDGTLWVTVFNNWGQLGNENTNTVYKWTQISTSIVSNIKSVAAGSMHSLALDNNGNLWVTGNNQSGQLGNSAINTSTNKWQKIPDNIISNVKFIAAGGSSSFAIRNDGTLWVAGENSFGQLGNENNTNVTSWSQIPTNIISNVKAVATNGIFSLAVKDDGTLWVTGHNDVGQLGTGNTNDINKWTQISTTIISKVKTVSCGGYHSLAITNDGKIYGTGQNDCGQLGTGDNNNKNNWTYIQTISNLVNISAGFNYSILIRENGEIFVTGKNDQGQIGLGDEIYKTQWTLSKKIE